MKKILALAGLVLCMSAGALWAQGKIVVGGSGAIRSQMEELAKAYMAQNPADSIEIVRQSMSSTGGIEGVRSGRLAIGVVLRLPEGYNKGDLLYTALARGAVGTGVHKSTPVTNLGESQLCDVFSGRIKSWKELGAGNGRIVVLTRKQQDDSYTQTMRSQVACFRDLQVTPDAILLIRGEEVLDALDRRPGTVSIINAATSSSDRPNIRMVAIGGVLPSAENLHNGKYRFFNEAGAVTLGQPQGLAKRFLQFVGGSEGRKVFAQSGWVSVQ